ncbi:LysR family transcriptional regulator [uncultured Roseibium sp.]|uniref:LysR family transcriptional regulator n=1 Tax=uncultured Roseibium sp. TaxID=1936171 RepID=UPI0032166BA8
MSKNTQIDWEDLRHFMALADGGSLSQAARSLGVDHTTVARRIASLEAALNLKLIERLPRSVHLTPEGQRIADIGSEMKETSFAILRAAGGAERTLSGAVCVSAPPVLSSAVLAPRLAGFAKDYPDIDITLIGEVAAADLDHRQADISLRLSRPDAPDLIARKLGAMPFAFYAAPDYDLPEAQWSFIGYDAASAPIPQHGWLERRRNGRAVVFRTNDSASQAGAARSGSGVALLPCFLGDADPHLKRLPSADAFPPRDIWMLVHDDLRRAPRIRAVMDVLAEIIAETCGTT